MITRCHLLVRKVRARLLVFTLASLGHTGRTPLPNWAACVHLASRAGAAPLICPAVRKLHSTWAREMQDRKGGGVRKNKTHGAGK